MDNGGIRAFGVMDCRMYLAIRLYSCMLSTDSKFIAFISSWVCLYNMGHSNMCSVVLSLSQNSHLVLISLFFIVILNIYI